MVRYNYSTQVEPPAPFVYARVSTPDESTSVSAAPAQVDSAADITVIPDHLVSDLGLVPFGDTPVEGFGSGVIVATTYIVRIGIHEMEPLLTKVISGHLEPHVLLGRDILNHYRVTLDGPSQLIEIGEPRGPQARLHPQDG